MMRKVLITLGFMFVGAIQGAIVAVLSLTPAWIEELVRPREYPLANLWTLIVVVAVALPIGALLGPVLGWLLFKRTALWRVFVEPAAGAIIGAWLAWVFLYFATGPRHSTRELMIGGLLGAVAAAARLRRSTAKHAATTAP